MFSAVRISAARLTPLVVRQTLKTNLPKASLTKFNGGIRNFAVSSRVFQKANVDKELVHKLDEELKYEQENDEGATENVVSQWSGSKVWQLEDKIGEKEVKLHRTFGTEKITVVFSTDSMAEQEFAEPEEDDEDVDPSFAVNCTVLVTKQGGKDAGTLEFGVVVEDGEFSIESVNYGRDTKLMHDETAEADWKRKGQYSGPIFQELDDDLQDLFGKYLEQRGFDEALADFIPAYVELKEQKEYEKWLKDVKDFVAA